MALADSTSVAKIPLPAPTAATEHRRITSLDGLRGLAILSVFIHHAFQAPLMWIGVDLFFVLSGFLITGILLNRKDAGQSYFRYFYARRACRILAPYCLLLAVSSCLFGTEWMHHWYWFAFFGNNFASAFGQAGNTSLQPLWSLAVEEQFYFFWPWVILFASERQLAKFSLATVLFAPLLRAVCTPLFRTHFPIYFLTPFRMDLLAAGAFLAIIWRRQREWFERARVPSYWCVVLAASVLTLFSRFPQLRTTSNTMAANTLIYSTNLVLVTALLIIALAGNDAFCKFLRLPGLRFIGTISYSMYLIHVSFILISARFFTNKVAFFVAALLGTIAYATFSWYLLERPLLNWQRRAVPGRQMQRSGQAR